MPSDDIVSESLLSPEPERRLHRGGGRTGENSEGDKSVLTEGKGVVDRGRRVSDIAF